MKYSIIFILLLIVMASKSAHAERESYYQDMWCSEMGGEVEVILSDGSRVDCLTDEFAIEIDFSYKWAESIGQALLYSELTNRNPAVLLIVKEGEHRFLARWHNAADGLGIRLFTIDF